MKLEEAEIDIELRDGNYLAAAGVLAKHFKYKDLGRYRLAVSTTPMPNPAITIYLLEGGLLHWSLSDGFVQDLGGLYIYRGTIRVRDDACEY